MPLSWLAERLRTETTKPPVADEQVHVTALEEVEALQQVDGVAPEAEGVHNLVAYNSSNDED